MSSRARGNSRLPTKIKQAQPPQHLQTSEASTTTCFSKRQEQMMVMKGSQTSRTVHVYTG